MPNGTSVNLIELIRYIHLNPVRAGIVSDPLTYKWSSHRNYLRKNPRVSWVTTEFGLSMFHSDPGRASSLYAQFLGEPINPAKSVSPIAPHPDDNRIAGSDAFLTKVFGAEWKPRSRETLQEVIAQCATRFQITEQLLTSPSKARHLVAARAWIARHAVQNGIASICAVARRLNRCESAIRQIMTHHRDIDR